MNNHDQTWKLIPENLPDNLQEATEQLHYAAQFLAATGHSFLSHQDDDAPTNLAWRQGLGLQSWPFLVGSNIDLQTSRLEQKR